MYIASAIALILTMSIGSFLTAQTPKSEWYKCIKPRALTPPNYVFPIVWTVLYFLLFLAFARSLTLRYTTINVLFVLLLILNIMWSYWYFYKKNIKAAAINIVLLIIINIAMIGIAIYKKDNHLAHMLTPHLLWITFAAVLNFMSLPKVKMCNQIMFG